MPNTNGKPREQLYPLSFRLIRGLYPLFERVLPGPAHRFGRNLFMTPFRVPFKPIEEEFLSTAEQFDLDVLGTSVRYYKWGEGTPIICVHGWMGRASQWFAFVDALTKAGFSVYAFDAKGHGNTDGKYSNILEFANAILQLQNHLKLDQVSVIGHSLGAASIFMAMTLGVKVDKLVSIAQPVKEKDIMDVFRDKINASEKLHGSISNWVEKNFDRPFLNFTTETNAVNSNANKVLVVHDTDDLEAFFDNGEWLRDQLNAEWMPTSGLGHFKILRSPEVIERTLLFLNDD